MMKKSLKKNLLMSEIRVFNASPLILLKKINALELIEKICDIVVVPYSVREEVLRGGREEWGDFFDRVDVRKSEAIDVRVLEWGLGKGESEAISLALANGWEVVLDDKQARNCAKSLGVKVRGTLGILLLAKHKGVIEKVNFYIDRLKKAGIYIDEKLERKVKELAKEK